MDIKFVATTDIKPYKNNPRNNEKAVGKVAQSLVEFGWQQPIVVDENMIVLAGHTRLAAAQALNMKEAPIYISAGLSEGQKTAYRIADNKTAEFAEWDKALLAEEFQLLAELEADMATTGYDLDEIARINDALMQFEGMDDELEEEEFDDPTLDGDVKNHVKMVLLYLDQQSEPRFRSQCDAIMKNSNLENITDAVVLAVENEHKNI